MSVKPKSKTINLWDKMGGQRPSREANRHDLYHEIEPTQWPLVYHPTYNISFLYLEKLHYFDSGKWGKIYCYLKEAGVINDDNTVRAEEAQESDLLVVHSQRYIEKLKWSVNVASITEVPIVAFLPNFLVQKHVLRAFRFQTGGSILAGRVAIDRGWAINLGGGFHHCSADRGGGFCTYADITLCIRFLFERDARVNRVMIVDLDAHQGNGHERDFMDDQRVYIMDVYNGGIYPFDGHAKRAIKRRVELYHMTGDEEYLQKVEMNLEGALNEFHPDLVVYNAGTDVLQGDPLGMLSITADGIIRRDEIVFSKVRSRGVPIVMMTSGGYLKKTSRIIADSILNLMKKGIITLSGEYERRTSLSSILADQSSLPKPKKQSLLWLKPNETPAESMSDIQLTANGDRWEFRPEADTFIGYVGPTDQTPTDEAPLNLSLTDFMMESSSEIHQK